MKRWTWLPLAALVLAAGSAVADEDPREVARRMEDQADLLQLGTRLAQLEQQALEQRLRMWQDPVLSVARLAEQLRHLAQEMDEVAPPLSARPSGRPQRRASRAGGAYSGDKRSLPEPAVKALHELARRTSNPVLKRYLGQQMAEVLRECDRPREALEVLREVARQTLVEVEELPGRERVIGKQAELLKERERLLVTRERALKQRRQELEAGLRQLEAQSAELKRYARQVRQREERLAERKEGREEGTQVDDR